MYYQLYNEVWVQVPRDVYNMRKCLPITKLDEFVKDYHTHTIYKLNRVNGTCVDKDFLDKLIRLNATYLVIRVSTKTLLTWTNISFGELFITEEEALKYYRSLKSVLQII